MLLPTTLLQADVTATLGGYRLFILSGSPQGKAVDSSAIVMIWSIGSAFRLYDGLIPNVL
ncbi:hypothetical protein KDH_00130 [Dictyobacter sp. S3.2.2.5]|uniref:Major facilitator superfamily (MFS) profile domain-containing protein n=1 Tax=Dictyobacter halimunensis TaxID=3026934 RepID=A0ABQ6FGR7_9CHLR|nr:hypothetical protein KDH_00130 [Dictyobacter sp. S3.2.2.5]